MTRYSFIHNPKAYQLTYPVLTEDSKGEYLQISELLVEAEKFDEKNLTQLKNMLEALLKI